MDLIVGEYDGYVNYFKRSQDGTLLATEHIRADEGVIKLESGASPVIVDWNNDGLKDLIVSSVGNHTIKGSVRIYLNRGTKSQYKFTKHTTCKVDGIEIEHHFCKIQVADLNNDGKKDLIVGNGSHKVCNLFFYENIGTNGAAEFKKSVKIMQTNNEPITSPYDSRFCFSDFDGNGSLDILISPYPNIAQFKNNIDIYLSDQQTFNIPIANKSLTKLTVLGITRNNQLFLHHSSKRTITIELFSLKGRRLLTRKLKPLGYSNTHSTISLNHIPAGIYQCNYFSYQQQGKPFRIKIIK